MKALISPNELVLVPEYVAGVLQYVPRPARVCELAEVQFEVAAPLFWVDAENGTDPGACYYDMSTAQIVTIQTDLPPYLDIPTSAV